MQLLQAAALRTPLKSKYSTLQGTPLPLFARRRSSGLQRQVRRTPVAAAGALCCVLSLLPMLLLWTSFSARPSLDAEARMRALQAAPGAPVMRHAEALAAMYPPTLQRVPGWHHHNHTTCADRFTLLLAADMDVASRDPEHGRWRSSLRRGSLCQQSDGGFHLEWIDEVPLTSALNAGGRGMELSELVWYDGALLACDDRTGVLYEIRGGVPIPAHILSDGDGRQVGSTFKCEWAAVRHGLLYVGGVGMEWAGEGSAHDRPQWVMTLDGGGQPEHYNWTASYEALRDAAGCSRPGYLWHEAAVWHDATERWLFMPRRASAEAWEEEADETRGTNLMLWAEGPARAPPAAAARGAASRGGGGGGGFGDGGGGSAPFERVTVGHAGAAADPRRGYSSVKVLPGSSHLLVALSTEEVRGAVASFVTVLDINGTVVMAPERIGSVKYEGLELATIDT